MGNGQGRNLLMNINIWRDGGKSVENVLQEVLSEHQEAFFHFEGERVPAQVFYRGCGIFLLVDIEKQSRHGPEKLALCVPAWAGAGPEDSHQSSLPISTMWFCDWVVSGVSTADLSFQMKIHLLACYLFSQHIFYLYYEVTWSSDLHLLPLAPNRKGSLIFRRNHLLLIITQVIITLPSMSFKLIDIC